MANLVLKSHCTIPQSSSTEKVLPYDESGKRTYERACKKVGVTPASNCLRNLEVSQSLDLQYYGLGPKSIIPVAMALMVSPSVCVPAFLSACLSVCLCALLCLKNVDVKQTLDKRYCEIGPRFVMPVDMVPTGRLHAAFLSTVCLPVCLSAGLSVCVSYCVSRMWM